MSENPKRKVPAVTNPHDLINSMIHARPFKRFVVKLTDGRELPVPHPEFIHVFPDGYVVWQSPHGQIVHVMALHVVGVNHKKGVAA